MNQISMIRYLFLILLLLTSLVQGVYAPVAQATAQVTTPAASLVVSFSSETSDQLSETGCEISPFTQGADSIVRPAYKPYAVIPADWYDREQSQELFFCSEETYQTLTLQEGQVAGWVEDRLRWGRNFVVGAVGGAGGPAGAVAAARVVPAAVAQVRAGMLGAGSTPGKSADALGAIKAYQKCTGGSINPLVTLSPITLACVMHEIIINQFFVALKGFSQSLLVSGLLLIEQTFIALVTYVGLIGIKFMQQILSVLLSTTTFVNHPYVQTGWTFVQAFTNFGFIIALLLIALLTALRIEGFNARRLLPRLIIAALLVNFSLVIGGFLIEASQLTMAVIIQGVGNCNPSTFGDCLIHQSQLFRSVYNSVRNVPDPSKLQAGLPLELPRLSADLSTLANFILANFMVWMLFWGLVALVIGFFIRYIVLLLLLIVSPLAFLAFAFPKAEQLGMKWWTMFLKYLIFGPVAVMVLTFVIRTASGAEVIGLDIQDFLLQGLVTILIMWIMFYLALTAGNKLGKFGSGAVLGFATGALAATGRLAAAPATLGYRGARAGAGIYYQKKIAPQVAYAGRYLEQTLGLESSLDAQGRPKAGKKPSFIQRALGPLPKDAEVVNKVGAANPKDPTDVTQVDEAKERLLGLTGDRDQDITTADLGNKEVGNRITDTQIKILIDEAKSTTNPPEHRLAAIQRLIALARNPAAAERLKPQQTNEIFSLETNLETDLDTIPRAAIPGVAPALTDAGAENNKKTNRINAQLNKLRESAQKTLEATLRQVDNQNK